jgi:DNA-binding GntR family transcriptional regulator
MPVPPVAAALSRSLLRETVYQRLLEAITHGTFTPGERLRDDELSSWLGASRTPIREALARLEQDGLVKTAPNRFTRVAIASSVEAREAHVIVAALQALAASLAAEAGAAADVERLREQSDRYDWALWRSDTSEALAADEALHRLILGRAGNHHLHRLLERLMTRVRWMELQSWPALADRATSQAHERLLSALAGQEPALAALAAREEWLNLGGLVENALAQAERRSRLEISD